MHEWVKRFMPSAEVKRSRRPALSGSILKGRDNEVRRLKF
jgi:hypothetical protein